MIERRTRPHNLVKIWSESAFCFGRRGKLCRPWSLIRTVGTIQLWSTSQSTFLELRPRQPLLSRTNSQVYLWQRLCVHKTPVSSHLSLFFFTFRLTNFPCIQPGLFTYGSSEHDCSHYPAYFPLYCFSEELLYCVTTQPSHY